MKVAYRVRTVVAACVVVVAIGCGSDGTTIPGTGRDASQNKDAAPTSDGAQGVDATDAARADVGDCSADPMACGEGRLKGPPPGCVCLGGCEQGYRWDGTRCERLDAGHHAHDSGVASDTGMWPDAVNVVDSGIHPDASVAADTGAHHDAGTTDAPLSDVPATDGGPRDGTVLADGGPVDGPTVDGGPRDGSTSDGGGTGLYEGDLCNPFGVNRCLQVPNMVCQEVGSFGYGYCMKTCNQANNAVGSTHNPACNGIAPNCLDYFQQGPSDSRCLNAVGPYGGLGQTPLDLCDPAVSNLIAIADTNGQDPVVCWPLCTVVLSNTDPNNLTCSGTFGTCISNPPQVGTLSDGSGNVYGLCGNRASRGSLCGDARGLFCQGVDRCVLNTCVQRVGTTCTGTTSCATAGEGCVRFGNAVTGLSDGFCMKSCDSRLLGQCGSNRGCELMEASGLPQGVCRVVSGTLQQHASCADPFGVGTGLSDCVDGTGCSPSGPGGDFTQAECLKVCDPSASTCVAPDACSAFNAPFEDYGVCI